MDKKDKFKELITYVVAIVGMLLFIGFLFFICVYEDKKMEQRKQMEREEKRKIKTEKLIYVGKGEEVETNNLIDISYIATYKFKRKKDNKELELKNETFKWNKDNDIEKKLDNLKKCKVYTVEYKDDELRSIIIENEKICSTKE